MQDIETSQENRIFRAKNLLQTKEVQRARKDEITLNVDLSFKSAAFLSRYR